MNFDGRNIDPGRGSLVGEASGQRAPTNDANLLWDRTPDSSAATTYFDRPVIKEPVWIWTVPAYFYTGGVAGAASVLAAVAGAAGLHSLARKCRWIAVVGTSVGGGLLVADLGRPERFFNMLRVFRASSPMSVGSWTLAASGSTSAAAAVLSEFSSTAPLGTAAGVAAAVSGLPLSTYTAVLVSTTAVPIWSQVRRTLPALFAASAVSGLASALDFMGADAGERRVVRRLGLIAKVAELAAAKAVEHEADKIAQVGLALHEGLSGALWKASSVCAGAGVVLSILGRRSKAARIASAVAGTASSVGVRFAIFHAGKASARDPKASFAQQHARQKL